LVVLLSALAAQALGTPLGQWLNEHYAEERVSLQPVIKRLEKEAIHTTEQLMALGKEGIKKLHIGAKYRALLKDALVHHLGESKGFDDGKMVTVPKPKPKPKKVDECGQLSLVELEVQQWQSAEATSLATPLGAWLLDNYPEERKKLKPIIKKLEGQLIWSFKELAALGKDGIEALSIPKVYRRALKDALLTHIARRNHVSDRMVAVPEGYNGLKVKRLAALRAAKAKAKRCTQKRKKRAQRKARKARKTRRHRKLKKCATGGCNRRLPVIYYPTIHTQDVDKHPKFVHVHSDREYVDAELSAH